MRVGLSRESIVELTKLGWFIVSPVKKSEIIDILSSQTSMHNFQRKFYIIRKSKSESIGKCLDDKMYLNLMRNVEGIHEYKGRIQEKYPVYLPKNSLLSQKVICKQHIRKLCMEESPSILCI